MENQYSVLWIDGLPGRGKTTFMSRVIEHVRNERRPDNTHLLYYYVSYENEKQYRSMLEVSEEQFTRKNERRTVDECQNSDDEKVQAGLNSHLAKAERDIFVVFDGLDMDSMSSSGSTVKMRTIAVLPSPSALATALAT
ncbi:uncharacterized protein IWZ02DRAFT_121113 [Phyllosticta citriasiana]